jgi:hypothetical protein
VNPRRWALALWIIAGLGLVLRVVYVLGWQNPTPQIQGDAFYYHFGANLFARGKGFPDPYAWVLYGLHVPGAQHPPLYIVVLAIPSVVGLTSYLDHQLFTCLLGSLSIVAVGYTGRKIGGPAVGLVAAVLAAGYPEFWVNDGLVLSESLSILVTAGVLLAAYRLAERRTLLRAAVLGVAVGLATLTRAELLLFVVLLLPLLLGQRMLISGRVSGGQRDDQPAAEDAAGEDAPGEDAPGEDAAGGKGAGFPRGVAPEMPASWRRGFAVLAVGALAGALVIAPWALYNQARFDHSEVISSGLGSTLRVANCPSTYYGGFKGFWDYNCNYIVATPPGDASDQDVAFRHQALDYIKAHKSVLPSLAVARLGRVWGFYRPTQQLQLDSIERRQLPVSRVGLAMFYSLAFASVGGVLELRRRRVPLSPLLAPIVAVSVSAIVFYGTTRFRAAAEPSLVLLGSVGLVALASTVLRPRRRPESTLPESTLPESTLPESASPEEGSPRPASATAEVSSSGAPSSTPD